MTITTKPNTPVPPFVTVARHRGAIFTEPLPVDEAMVEAKLDYSVEFADLHYSERPNPDAGRPAGNPTPILDHFAVLRRNTDDTVQPLGVVKKRYQLVQNSEAFAYAQLLLDEFDAKVVAAATYGPVDGARAFLVVQVPRPLLVNDTEVVRVFVMVTNSHEGSSSLTASVVPIMESTGTQIETHLPGHDQIMRIAHKGDVNSKMVAVAKMMRMVEDWALDFEQASSRMLRTPFSADQFTALANHLLPTPADASDKSTDEWAVRRSRLTARFTQPAIAVPANTVYAAFNAVCEYADHVAPAQSEVIRAERSVNGESAKMKRKAWQWLAAHVDPR